MSDSNNQRQRSQLLSRNSELNTSDNDSLSDNNQSDSSSKSKSPNNSNNHTNNNIDNNNLDNVDNDDDEILDIPIDVMRDEIVSFANAIADGSITDDSVLKKVAEILSEDPKLQSEDIVKHSNQSENNDKQTNSINQKNKDDNYETLNAYFEAISKVY
jgi:hypothetical protein